MEYTYTTRMLIETKRENTSKPLGMIGQFINWQQAKLDKDVMIYLPTTLGYRRLSKILLLFLLIMLSAAIPSEKTEEWL